MNDTPLESLFELQGKDTSISVAEISAEMFSVLETFKNPLKSYDYLRITDTTEIEQPIPVVKINEEIISTEGNLTTVSGAAKSGKTAFTGILIAGAVSSDGNVDGLEGVYVEPNKFGKAVIHIDTEQARHRHQSNQRTIFRRCGLKACPDYFRSYNFRELDLDEYLPAIEEICAEASVLFNGIHLIVIDGIADFIPDVNDPIRSNALVKKFEELAIKYKTPIIFVVHTNPGSNKERGHLGSQCQRKSESVIIVKNEGDVSFIEPKFLRMAGKGNIPLIQFMYDKVKGYHVGCGIRSNDEDTTDVKRVAQIRKVCEIVFGGISSYSYGSAIEAIMRGSDKGESTAKGMFKEMRAHRMIFKGSDKKWRLNSGEEEYTSYDEELEEEDDSFPV